MIELLETKGIVMNLAFDLEVKESFVLEAPSLNLQEKLIHERALLKSELFKKAHAELLEVVMDIDRLRLFEKFLLNSTFSYCTKILGLSEDVTCTLTRLARVSVVVPELKNAIDEGSLNISNARQIAAILTPENKTEWLERAKSLSQKKLQYEVAKFFPQQAVQEKAKYISEERVKLEMGLDIKIMENFRRAQDLISQKIKTSASLEVTQEELLKFYLERNDPLLRAKRALKAKKPLKEKTFAQNKNQQKVSVAIRGAKQNDSPKRDQVGTANTNFPKTNFKKRKPIPAAIRHAVILRDGSKCQALLPNGNSCGQTRWLEHHHKIPLQMGGQDKLENLVTLCSFHHRIHHDSDIGF